MITTFKFENETDDVNDEEVFTWNKETELGEDRSPKFTQARKEKKEGDMITTFKLHNESDINNNKFFEINKEGSMRGQWKKQ